MSLTESCHPSHMAHRRSHCCPAQSEKQHVFGRGDWERLRPAVGSLSSVGTPRIYGNKSPVTPHRHRAGCNLPTLDSKAAQFLSEIKLVPHFTHEGLPTSKNRPECTCAGRNLHTVHKHKQSRLCGKLHTLWWRARLIAHRSNTI